MSKILGNIDVNDYSLQKMKVEDGGEVETETKTVKSTTTSQTIYPTSGKYISQVTVEPIVLEEVSVTPSTSSQTITPSQNKDGINQVNVSAIETEQKTVKSTTTSQTITPTSGKYIDEITVNPISTQNKSVTITENTTTTIQADSGYDGLGTVEVMTNVSGSSFPPDWTQIGYTDTPQSVIDDFNYSKNIADNWDASLTSLSGKFQNNADLVFMPNVDTSNVTNLNSTWKACAKLTHIPLLDTSHVTDWTTAFANCSSLKSIPQLDMSGNTYNGINQTFYNCNNLVNVPVFSTGNANKLSNMFQSCNRLSNESLNNIMRTCINSRVTNASYKTLKSVGLSSAQATTCQSLSNWDAFVAAGWSSGY